MICICNEILMSLQPGDSVMYLKCLLMRPKGSFVNVLLSQGRAEEDRAGSIMYCHKSIPVTVFIHTCSCSDDL